MHRILMLLLATAAAGCSGGGERAAVAPDSAGDLPVIGHLRGRDHNVTIYSSPEGPRYTVRNLAGEMIADSLTQDELQSREPGLFQEIRSLIAESKDGDLIDLHLPRAEAENPLDVRR